MRFLVTIPVSLITVFFAASAFAATTCPDISGRYRAPWSDQYSKTVISYDQSKCDSLVIGGYTIDYAESSDTQYNPLSVRLNGQLPANDFGWGPCFSAAPGVCASYSYTSSYIVKTLYKPDTGFFQSPKGALCTYHVAYLSKNSNGDLIEQPESATCADGYKGSAAPIVYSAAK